MKYGSEIEKYYNFFVIFDFFFLPSPVRDVVLVNDRWGIEANCKHGDVKTCGTDRFNPSTYFLKCLKCLKCIIITTVYIIVVVDIALEIDSFSLDAGFLTCKQR